MKVLLVIDMLNDFLDKKGALYCGDAARKIIPFVKDKIDKAHNKGDQVIFLCDSHKEDDKEFELFPKHCIEDTWGSEIIPELEIGPEDIALEKSRYSGFYDTPLSTLLAEIRKDYPDVVVEVVGVCTSICIMDTVGELRNRDYTVIVSSNGVADFDEQGEMFALRRMREVYGAKVL